eukprot:1188273-Prymnesium_polylepis.1
MGKRRKTQQRSEQIQYGAERETALTRRSDSPERAAAPAAALPAATADHSDGGLKTPNTNMLTPTRVGGTRRRRLPLELVMAAQERLHLRARHLRVHLHEVVGWGRHAVLPAMT